jgi:hypothetical protein
MLEEAELRRRLGLPEAAGAAPKPPAKEKK